ncbi:MAG TPA: EamA family transporter [Alphaproteobacteria bacterium]|nr:EamA family transporter [Alphaproteobacteria bacterium]
MLGALYALLAAASFGLNNASARRGVIGGSAIQGLAITVPLGMLMFVPATFIAGEMGLWTAFTPMQWLFLSGAGFAHFVWGRYFNIKSLEAIGTNLAGPVQQSQHPIALFLAIVFLGETLTAVKVVGILLIAMGPVVMLKTKKPAKVLAPQPVAADAGEVKAAAKPVFKPRMAEGYFHAFMAGLGFGASPVLFAAGIGDTGLAMIGGLISFIAATIIVGLILLYPGQIKKLRATPAASIPWFLVTALATFGSQFFRYLALAIAPVTVVQPIQSLSLIFRMIFGYFISRDYERLDAGVFYGLALAFSGAVVLAIGDEAVRRYIALPDWLMPLAAWTWP